MGWSTSACDAATVGNENEAGTEADLLGHEMFSARAMLAFLSVVALTAGQARAEDKEKEPDAIIELGGSGNLSLSGPFNFGPTAAVEFLPVENWLEIEIGTGPMFGRDIGEWDTDILFKKPFTLSDKVEFMIGAGPQWSSAFRGSTNAGFEVAGDFMIWPWPDRKLGWFVEPSYSYSFIGGHEQSFGLSLGLLFPVYAKK